MRMDLASQTQKLVESKLTIQQLHDQNSDLHSDLHLSINLLRNRPTSFMSQRLDTLPPDIQQRVRTCLAENARDRRLSRGLLEGRKIRVAIPSGVGDCNSNGTANIDGDSSDKISAAILAKVLEERDKERQGEREFRIDVGTQTHGWNHFPSADGAQIGRHGGGPTLTSSSSSSSTTGGSGGGANKDICDGSNKCESLGISPEENSSSLMEDINQPLTKQPKPLQDASLLPKSEIKDLKYATTAATTTTEAIIEQEILPAPPGAGIPPALTPDIMKQYHQTPNNTMTKDANFLPNEQSSYLTSTVISKTLKNLNLNLDNSLVFSSSSSSAFGPPNYSHSNVATKSNQEQPFLLSSTFVSNPPPVPAHYSGAVASSVMSSTPSTSTIDLISSKTATTTFVYPNIINPPRTSMAKLESASFSASAASSFLTRSATFSAMQTDI